MPTLSLIFGAVVGLSLGLTGGGGAIFAVPLLVYGLSVDPRQAVGISLASVSVTSAVGFVGRWRAGQVELLTGLMFGLAGVLGAPIGSWFSNLIPESLLLLLFAVLMFIVATRMWHKAALAREELVFAMDEMRGATCRRDAAGELTLTSPCALLLGILGVATGILSGLFGVGGGFIIVPALVLFSGMGIHRAVGTSLMAISLISAAGVGAHLLAGRNIPFDVTLYFVVGGVVGLLAGMSTSQFLSGPALQKVFALAIVAVAIFVIVRTTLYF